MRPIAVLMTKAIAEKKNKMMLMGLAAGLIDDVKSFATDFMFPPPSRPVVSLPQAPKIKFQTPISHALYSRKNFHWTMLSRFAIPKNFSRVHTLDTVSNVQSMFSANVPSLITRKRP